MKTTHDIKYQIGQVVYLKTDTEQLERIVTGICLRPNGCVIYYVTLCANEYSHYDFELSDTEDIVKKTTN